MKDETNRRARGPLENVARLPQLPLGAVVSLVKSDRLNQRMPHPSLYCLPPQWGSLTT